ncbi:hypothetical protein NJO91_13340 [Streptomyces microflavus]|uniref:hypothetical protein n=1 Tax=Streptomyces microflavus TaxID=1919 RepID=UPI0029AD9042|nr:hypothetical protein [Streptomyces microflavus]MDX2404104.1 hypothetical protein [Streptomyces microflavus]
MGLLPLAGRGGSTARNERYVAYSDQDTLRWILATQLVRDLTGCEPVDDLDPPLRAGQARASSAVGLPLHDVKDDSPS